MTSYQQSNTIIRHQINNKVLYGFFMTYTDQGKPGATRSAVTTQERAAKLSPMHFYAFTMHNSADKEGDELALLHVAREKLACQEGIVAICGLLQRCYLPA